MLDLILLAAVAGFAVLVLAWMRSAALSALLIGFAVSASGTFVQFLATFGFEWTRASLQVCLVITLGACAGIAWWLRRGRRGPLVLRPAVGTVLLTSGVIAGLLTIVRFAAPSDLLQSVGYLITQPVGEDNAKWLATGAQLASGAPIDTFSAVGGPLLLVMALAAGMASALSTLTLGGINEVAVSANTILLSQALLIALVPFAVAPMFEGRVTRWTPSGDRVRGPLPVPLALLAVTIVGSASVLVTQYGHLTLQYVLLALTMWVAFWAIQMRRLGALVLTTLATAMTAQVWFPMGVLAVILLLALVAWGLMRIRRPQQRTAAIVTVAAALVTGVMMSDFLRSSIAFSLSSTPTASEAFGGAARGIAAAVHIVGESTLDIFGQPGGTEVLSATMFALIAASLFVSFVLLAHGRRSRSKLVPFLPVIALLGFTLGVVILDFWSTGKGPGYASNKMFFATGIPILAVFLPIALLRLDPAQRRLTATRWAAIGVIAFLLVADTFVPRAIARLKPDMFPAAGDPPAFWSLAEVRDTANQSLESNPLGCVYLPPGADRPSVLPNGQLAYSCSRIMSGLSGAGVSAGPFVAWQLDEWLQNTAYWDYYAPALNGIPEDVRGRNVILLGDKDKVVGLASLQSLLDRYPPETTDAP